MAAVVLLAVSTVAWLAYRSSVDTHRTDTVQRLALASAEKQAALAHWFDHGLRELDRIAASTSTLLVARPDAAASLLNAWSSEHLVFSRLELLSPDDGSVVQSSEADAVGKRRDHMPYFKAGKRGPYLQAPYFSPSSGMLELMAATPVRSDEGQLVGVLAGTLNKNGLRTILRPRGEREADAQVHLISKRRLLIGSRPADLPASGPRRAPPEPALERCLAGKSGVSTDARWDGEPVLIAYTWLPQSEFCVSVQQSVSSALLPAYGFGRQLSAIAALCALVAIVVGLTLAGSLARPLTALTEQVRAFGAGIRPEPTSPGGASEIRELAGGLHTMMLQLDERGRAIEKRFFNALESVPDGFALFDASDRLVTYNETWRYGFNAAICGAIQAGMTFEELVRRAVDAGAVYEARENPEEWIRSRVRDHRSGTSRRPVELRPGTWIEITERRIDDGSTVLVIVDVTERFLRLRELRRYEVMTSTATELMVMFDRELRIVSANDAYVRYHGLERDSVIGARLQELLGGHIPPVLEEALPALWAGQRQSVETWVHYRNLGRRWMHGQLAPYLDEKGEVTAIVGVARDETALREAAETREELEAQLRQTQKMEAFGDLSGGFAHDFNNILASVMGHAQLAERALDKNLDERLRGYLQEILRAGTRAKELVGQLLKFSSSKVVELDAIDVRSTIAETCQLLRSSLPATIDLSVDVATDLEQVRADPTEISQVLMNLGINARDFVGRHGRIRIEAYNTRVDTVTCASCRSKFAGEMVCLRVTDSGPGVVPTTTSRIFEPFYSTKEVGLGSGMGLAIVHGIVHRHGGHISVVTENRIGAEFRCYLPVADMALEPANQPARQLSRVDQAPRRVAVVDDEPALTTYLHELLTGEGFDVSAFTDSTSAWNAIQQGATFDVVITDQTMPGLTGIELVRLVRTEGYETPVILCTGFGHDLAEELLTEIGHIRLMYKPVDAKELIDAVRQAA